MEETTPYLSDARTSEEMYKAMISRTVRQPTGNKVEPNSRPVVMSKLKRFYVRCASVPLHAFAKSGSVNYSWEWSALATMHDFVVTMMLYVQYICCTIAGVYVIVSVCQIYIKMNTGEDGITKSDNDACRRVPVPDRGILCFPGFLRLPHITLLVSGRRQIKYSLKSKRMFENQTAVPQGIRIRQRNPYQSNDVLLHAAVRHGGESAELLQATIPPVRAHYPLSPMRLPSMPIMVKLCYAIAGVVAIVGAISVYIAMNNEEQDVKKKIMMVVGACIFLIAAAKALPLFFGIAA